MAKASRAIARRRRSIFVRSVGRRAKKTTIPLAVVAGFFPLGVDLVNSYKVDGIPAVMSHLSLCTTGYDGVNKWNPMYALQKFYAPVLAGIVVHKLAGKFGVNRMLASAGIPLLRV
jgi:hypothetical protein